MEVDGSESEWRISIQKCLDLANEDCKSNKWKKVTIYHAPPEYREVNSDCLVPKRFSLGPYHSSNSMLSEENPLKWRVLYYMLKRNEQEICPYLNAMMKLEPEARSCYEGKISQNKNEFVKMMVLDGCFIIEFLLCLICNNEILGYPDSHPFYDGTVQTQEIISDILLLENQIPIFVLEKLAQQQKNPAIGVWFIPNRAIWMFNYFMSPDKRDQYEEANDEIEGINGDHILDIVRKNLLTDIPTRDEKDDFTFNFPSASKLKEFRVKFKALEGQHFKVNFSDQTIQLTQLNLENRSKTLFCNLIAYEQRHRDRDKVITSYFMFMNQLIGSDKDVEHLIKSKIIRSMLGSHNEVVDLFDKTTTKDMFSMEKSYTRTIVKSINKHVNNTWYRWKANLIEKYFKTPWSTISIVAAFSLILLTFIQTFYAVYGYYYPPKP